MSQEPLASDADREADRAYCAAFSREIGKLKWIRGKVNNQFLDIMLDSGATNSCIARRCVTASSYLKDLPRHPYNGPGLVDVNGNSVSVAFVIRAPLVLGSPSISIYTNFAVVDDLPYSCILGSDYLDKLERWGINNKNRTFEINDSACSVFERPQHNNRINLVTQGKTVLSPGEVVTVATSAKGTDPFRPISDICFLTDGDPVFENRTKLIVMPSVNSLTHSNISNIPITVKNTSDQKATIKKGIKLVSCSEHFEYVPPDVVNIMDKIDPIDYLCSDEKLGHLTKEERSEVRKLLSKYRHILTVSSSHIGRTWLTVFDLPTDNIRPIADPLRRVPLQKVSIVKDLLEKYEELGLVEQTDSPFRAPTVLVEKKNVAEGGDITDKYRLCVDYRSLNSKLENSGWPTPSLEHCLDAAADVEFLSSIDFNSGYNQIPCSSRAKEALAFCPGYGFPQYTWEGMPPGIKPASHCFQRTMEKMLSGAEDSVLPPFFDDVVIKGYSFRDHLNHVDEVLSRVEKSGFTLNALKCFFFQRQLEYLGHIIGGGKVSLDPKRVSVIQNFPTPRNVKEVRRFIGMAQFCRRFIKDLNVVLSPLYDLTKTKVHFVWSEECQCAFEKVKSMLTTPPVLVSPSDKSNFILETDASDVGIGHCLKVSNGGEEFIVGYGSGKFQKSELNWNVVEKEASAILEGITKNRHYLLGKKFTIRTDSRVLTYLHEKREPKNKKLLNWALQLSEYDYEIVHIPSRLNGISDCLSRMRMERVCMLIDMRNEQVNMVSTVPFLFDNSELEVEQNKDPHIACAFQYLRENRKNFDVATLGDLKRGRKKLSINSDGLLTWNRKIVVPPTLRKRVLQSCHDHPLSGHFASERTWSRLSKNYFWPKAKEDVDNWVHSCKTCNEFNVPAQGYVRQPLKPIVTTRRFEVVCYDLAGPFMPKTERGNTHALIIVDHFSKWPEIVALPNTKAPTIAQGIFDQWICRYGVPGRLHSDGANNVNGSVMQQLSELLGIDKSKSSRLHPQGDGLSEAVVKIVKSVIRKHVDKYGANWDLYLQSAAFAIRSNINSSTGVSPSELLVGGMLAHPSDMPASSAGHQPALPLNVRQAKAFAQTLGARLKDSNKIVNESSEKSRSQMKQTYDKNVTSHRFEVGDQVMIWDPPQRKGISRSFQPKWSGPWTISRFIGSTNCRLENDKGKEKFVHLNILKKVEARSLQHDDRVQPTIVPPLFQPPPRGEALVDPIIFESVDREDDDEEEDDDDYQPRYPIDAAYVDIDESNILERRLRR